ncbi:hypothetical protein HZU73_05970 [Apis mellifera caucasica]|uniref:Uncharacterized protein LOC408608 n=2 Tax=cellular organisms TaxID=131567 RepID=A0A7M7R8W1_APIME|nr:uncharacterized protein LOC408608 [Apis mellifera]KAG6798611.1 hypothetical protein HZU73_05970 [Apis mellifera caucasica]KAG9437224.1 hypothetical protein HZU67_00233 [Apis mellifera carnica]|eukprot:XP_397512.1 uncharacterized protein LOC408608 [Apis mellifera]
MQLRVLFFFLFVATISYAIADSSSSSSESKETAVDALKNIGKSADNIVKQFGKGFAAVAKGNLGTVNLTKVLKSVEDRLKLPTLSKYSKEAKSQIVAAREQVANALLEGSSDLIGALKDAVELAIRASTPIENLIEIFDTIKDVYFHVAVNNSIAIGLNIIEDGVLICQVIVETMKVALKV